MNYLVYFAVLALVYIYTNTRDSVGLLWALIFVLAQATLVSIMPLSIMLSAVLTGGVIVLVFEVLQLTIGDPFSRSRVFQWVAVIIECIAGVLARVGVKPRSTLIDVKANAAARQVFIRLQADRFTQVEHQLLELPDGARHHLIRGLAGVARRPAEFDAWLTARPTSSLACIVSGQQRLAAGWHARGTGLAATVTPGRQARFLKSFAQARADFKRAISLDDTRSDPHVGMIAVVMGSSGSRTELWDAFAKARVHAENHYQAHIAMVTALSPLWGGDPGEALGFGRITVRQAAPDSALVGVLAAAHIQNWLQLDSTEQDFESGMYFRQSAVVQELQEAYWRLNGIEQLDADIVEALNAFAFCFYKGGQFDLTREVIRRLDGRYCEFPWQYCTRPLLATFNIAFAIDHVLQELRRPGEDPQHALG